MRREETARRLAEVCGWEPVANQPGDFWVKAGVIGGRLQRHILVHFPDANEPLPDHLQFVGYVAESLPEGWSLRSVEPVVPPKEIDAWVTMAGPRRGEEERGIAMDLSLAAALARIEVGGGDE